MGSDTLQPLLEAVRLLESSALHNISSQQQILMMAAASPRSLRHDQVPSLIHVMPHKTRGPRLEEPRARDINMTTAHWPQDNLVETRQPILCGSLGGCATLPMGQGHRQHGIIRRRDKPILRIHVRTRLRMGDILHVGLLQTTSG